MLKQRLGTGAFYSRNMLQPLNKARNDVLQYINSLHLMAVKFQNVVWELFSSSSALPAQPLQTSLRQEIFAVSMSITDCGCVALIVLCRSISKRDAADNGWPDILVDGAFVPSGKSSAVFEAGGIGVASGARPTKLGLLYCV